MSHKISEVYYSDSDSDSDLPSVLSKQELVQLLGSGLSSVVSARGRRMEARMEVVETLTMVERLKSKLEEKMGSNEIKIGHLDNVELQLKKLKVKSIAKDMNKHQMACLEEEARQLLAPVAQEEMVLADTALLQAAVTRSTLKIQFDQPDEMLIKLKADSDEICLRLSTGPRDSELTFLTCYLLKTAFTDMISSRNPIFLQRLDHFKSLHLNTTLKQQITAAAIPLTSTSLPLPKSCVSPPQVIGSTSFSAMAQRAPTPSLHQTLVKPSVEVTNRP